jgi:FlaA1/EpsC-like NDP-sugar epimerase
MGRKGQVRLYVMADLLASALAWTGFFLFRKLYMEPLKFGHPVQVEFDQRYWLGMAVIPVFWVGLFLVIGGYSDIFRRFRTKELGQTLLVTFHRLHDDILRLLLDDTVAAPKPTTALSVRLFGLNFLLLFLFRFLLTSRTVNRVHRPAHRLQHLLVGGNERAVAIHAEIEGLRKSPGNRFVGFVNVNGGDQQLAEGPGVPRLGKWTSCGLIPNMQVEEAIIAVESSEHEHISRILNELDGTAVRIKIIPDMYDILAGSVKMTSIFGAPLIEVNPQIMPAWQFALKRISTSSVAVRWPWCCLPGDTW